MSGMPCPRWEWHVIGLVLLVQQALSQGIQQLVDNPSIAIGSNAILQVTGGQADMAKGQWYLAAPSTPVRQVPDNDRTPYSVSGVYHQLTITNVMESDGGRYYYLFGQGILRQGLVTVVAGVAVDGGFSDWSRWGSSQCSVTCGAGVTADTRSRTCTNPVPQNGGRSCLGPTAETRTSPCTTPCPVNGGISAWSPWSDPSCPVTCGAGVRNLTRSRTCTEPVPQFGGRDCPETRQETSQRACSVGNCPINGGWTIWLQWENPPCSRACGNFSTVVRRVRTCTNPQPQNSGGTCIGPSVQTATRSCNLPSCSGCTAAIVYFIVDGSESVSFEYFQLVKEALRSFVSSTISRNNMMQVGVVVFNNNVTDVITASSSITSLQSSISSLSRPSGGTSTHLGIRRGMLLLNQDTSGIPRAMVVITDGLSNSPELTRAAAAEAKNSGITMFAVGVNDITFPSIAQRFRAELLSIASSNATAITITNFTDLGNSVNGISELVCKGPVNGIWSSWGRWSAIQCSETCGQNTIGNITRSRTCTNPAPLFNGSPCLGSSEEALRRICVQVPCPIHGGLSMWTVWSTPQCDSTCGSGVMGRVSRGRTCTNPQPSNGGRPCQGLFTETDSKTCGLPPCVGEVHGGFGQWTTWTASSCSATCGRNVIRTLTRQRFCNSPVPANGGRDCSGLRNETMNQSCTVPECPGCTAVIVYFIVDGSESVSFEYFQLVKEALRSFVSSTISRNNRVQVGVVVFSNNVTDVITASSSITSLQSSISSLSRPSGGTSTHLGIRRGMLLLNQDTSGVPRAMVVITDGLSNSPELTRAAAAEAKNSGITLFAVGVSLFTSPLFVQRFRAELLSIASSNATAIEITNFNGLDNSLNGISGLVCKGPVPGGWSMWTVWSTPQCNATCGSGVMGRVSRRRTCTNPSPSNGGSSCQGLSTETDSKTCGLPPCVGEVHGGFGQWTTWTASSCSATCGRNVIRTLTRQRFCNSPVPANGGRDCSGLRNETRNQICPVSECPVTAVCDDVKKYYGVGYRHHPTDCQKYIQCYYNPNGNVLAVSRSCYYGYFWNQASLRCMESWRVSCPLEPCRGPCGSSYKMEGSCRSYWKCKDGKSVARCCPRGFSFSPGDGCLENHACNDDCPSPYVSRDICARQPSWINATTYNVSFENAGWRSCPGNTYFNILDCDCTEYCTEKCEASYEFMAGARPSWMVLERVDNRAGALSLTDASRVHIDVTMTVSDNPVVFTFTYRDTVAANESRVLASSKNRLIVSTNSKGVTFTITSWYGDVTRMMLSTDGMPSGQWRTVSVMYKGKYLVGTVMNNNVKFMDRVFVENTNILSDGLTIGSDASSNPGRPFVGDIGRVSVYRCDPGILV